MALAREGEPRQPIRHACHQGSHRINNISSSDVCNVRIQVQLSEWTQVVCGGRLLEPSQALDSRVCVHAKHDERLNTVDENGNHRARLAAEYPPELCEVLAKMA